MPSPTAVQIALTLFGAPASGLSVQIGSTVDWTFTLENPGDRTSFDLTGKTVEFSACALDLQGQPVQPPLIQKAGVVAVDPTTGIATATWNPADTSPVPPAASIPPGQVGIDLWVKDGAGNRLPLMPLSILLLTGAATLP